MDIVEKGEIVAIYVQMNYFGRAFFLTGLVS